LLATCLFAVAAVQSNADVSAEGSAVRAKHGVRAQVKRGTLFVTGNRRANKVTLRLQRRKRGVLEVDVARRGKADFRFRRRAFKRIVVRGGGGNDSLRVDGRFGAFTRAERTTLDGGSGNDALSGGRMAETLRGGRGNDRIAGAGSDRVSGGRGSDRLDFTGTAGADAIALSANGARLRVSHNVGKVRLNATGVERAAVAPLGGADAVTIGDLRRTGLVGAALDLRAAGGRARADGAADTVAAAGTGGDDTLTASRSGGTISLGGLPWAIAVANSDDSLDRLAVNGLGGADTLVLLGSDAADSFTLAAGGATLRATAAGASVDADDVESVRVNALGGGDTVDMANLAGTDVTQSALDLSSAPGGPGDGQVDSVSLTGGSGADTVSLSGGPGGISAAGLGAATSIAAPEPGDRLAVNGLAGADALNASGMAANAVALTLRGGPDADTLTGSPGDDAFGWSRGDGADLIEAGAGADRLNVSGSDASESFRVFSAGPRARISHDLDSTTIEADDVESAGVTPAGAPDTVTVADMTGTDLTKVDVDLAAPGGGGDGQADGVVVEGTAAADAVTVQWGAPGATVAGLAAATVVNGADASLDRLTVSPLASGDTVDASGLAAGFIALTMDGGLGGDVLIGGQGADTADGGPGNDVALLGAGDDNFRWEPGDGSDVVEGQAGTDDTLTFTGSNGAENIVLFANGSRLSFFRDIAAVTMDMNDVETVNFSALGGTDSVVLNDVSGTDLDRLSVALAAASGGGDAATDNVTVNGTAGNDVAVLSGSASGVTLTGLPALVSVTGAEAADRLTTNALNGDDVVDASGVAAGSIALTINGGANNDVLLGGAGNDIINGNDGDDVLIGGPGVDALDGGTGSNVVIQD
jgi:Ca2+-binding RTX toxin-like protein